MPFVQTVPVFKLYGEECGWPTPDLLQIEKLDHFRMLMDANMPLIQAAAL